MGAGLQKQNNPEEKMKSKLAILIGISLAGQLALACMGGHQLSLEASGKKVALIDKSAKKLTLANNVSLTYIGDCRIDNADADLRARQFDLSGYYEEGRNLCVGLSTPVGQKNFVISNDELNRIARSAGCGGTVSPTENR
jgi:hypothetical protein